MYSTNIFDILAGGKPTVMQIGNNNNDNHGGNRVEGHTGGNREESHIISNHVGSPLKESNFNKIVKNRILCFNMLNTKHCSYADKCLYAHSLETQHIDKYKKEALDLLSNPCLQDLDLL